MHTFAKRVERGYYPAPTVLDGVNHYDVEQLKKIPHGDQRFGKKQFTAQGIKNLYKKNSECIFATIADALNGRKGL